MIPSFFLPLVAAPLVAGYAINPFQQITPRSACEGNTADTRSQWCDYSINTDYANEVPDTGVTREYYLDLTEVEVAPDGISRYAMAINGTIPGPTLHADWGDNVVVHLTNNLKTSTNGTSLHFHGIRQNYTNDNDGVASITQCPTAPGNTFTYKWRATQYGSTWYHSHFALQAWQGVFGGIVINGPATANYDKDLGLLFMNDWSHQTVDELWDTAQAAGPPQLDNCLLNGTNTFNNSDSTITGSRYELSLEEGKSHRIRLVNTAIDTHFKFSIDNHTMTVIAMDLVPIEPFTADVISIGIAQRYDVIVTADQGAIADKFWLRATPQSACSDVADPSNIKGVVYYGDKTDGEPTTVAHTFEDSCTDMDSSLLVPHVKATVGPNAWQSTNNVDVGTNDESFFRWYINSTTMIVHWGDPTVMQLHNDETSFAASNAVLHLATADQPSRDDWAYVVVQSDLAVAHPIHLHGHDFHVLSAGEGAYEEGTTALNLDNPVRRDTAMLPAAGHLVLAFKTDNPGAWLMHCHIGWHTSEGFALQFVERQAEIPGILDTKRLEDTCSAWNNHEDVAAVVQGDSGI
ncbi:multicopper oxidase [Apiospora rasikravindrae]|uniref:Multicopper oxidase n=1 Tax=Apiospora rasikravindrae TaxID=990691 RepID=A0ABR1SDQ5_9PEZI